MLSIKRKSDNLRYSFENFLFNNPDRTILIYAGSNTLTIDGNDYYLDSINQELNGALLGGGDISADQIVTDVGDYKNVEAALNALALISRLTEDLNIIGTELGALSDGDTLVAGTTFENVFRAMAIQQIPPAYVAPALAIADNLANNREAGSIISPQITPTFHQRDGGAMTALRFYRGATLLHAQTDETPYTDAGIEIGDETLTYRAEADYAEGPVKNDNLGQPYPDGQIAAGTANSNNLTFRGQRNLFFDAPANTDIIDSNYIRAVANKQLNPANGTSFTIHIPAGASRVLFAYPAGLRDVSTVKYVEGLNAEVKEVFNLSTVAVEGANGFAAINYKVYVYEPAAPFGSAATYNVTI